MDYSPLSTRATVKNSKARSKISIFNQLLAVGEHFLNNNSGGTTLGNHSEASGKLCGSFKMGSKVSWVKLHLRVERPFLAFSFISNNNKIEKPKVSFLENFKCLEAGRHVFLRCFLTCCFSWCHSY